MGLWLGCLIGLTVVQQTASKVYIPSHLARYELLFLVFTTVQAACMAMHANPSLDRACAHGLLQPISCQRSARAMRHGVTLGDGGPLTTLTATLSRSERRESLTLVTSLLFGCIETARHTTLHYTTLPMHDTF